MTTRFRHHGDDETDAPASHGGSERRQVGTVVLVGLILVAELVIVAGMFILE
jgi:hypothetical protein